MGKKKQLLVAIIVGAIALLGNQMYIGSRISQYQNKRYVEVVRAKKLIKAGVPYSPTLVEKARVPEDYVPKAKIDWVAKDQYTGQNLAIDILAGDYILETSFTTTTSVGRTLSQQLEGEEFRAITIPVDDTASFARSIVTGDRVDILYSFSMPSLRQRLSTILLQNVPIISTGSYSQADQELGDKGKSTRYNSITLKLSASDAMRLTYARQAGSIQLLLRSLKDSKILDTVPITGIEDILSANDKAMVESMLKQEKQKGELSPQAMDQLREQARIAIEQQKRQAQALGINRDKER